MELIECYIATRNETDAHARRKMIDDTWTDAAAYVDPPVVAEGKEVIDQVVAGARQQFAGLTLPARRSGRHAPQTGPVHLGASAMTGQRPRRWCQGRPYPQGRS